MGGLVGDRNQKIEACTSVDIRDQFAGEVLGVGDDERLPRGGLQDAAGQVDQFGRCGNYAASRGGSREADRLMCVGVEHPEGLSHLGRFGAGVLDPLPHVAFAITAPAMGINGDQSCLKVSRGATDSTQGNLESDTFGDGVIVE